MGMVTPKKRQNGRMKEGVGTPKAKSMCGEKGASKRPDLKS